MRRHVLTYYSCSKFQKQIPWFNNRPFTTKIIRKSYDALIKINILVKGQTIIGQIIKTTYMPEIWMKTLDKGSCVWAVFMDLSKAFDTLTLYAPILKNGQTHQTICGVNA